MKRRDGAIPRHMISAPAALVAGRLIAGQFFGVSSNEPRIAERVMS